MSINIKGKEFITFKEALDKGHKNGLTCINSKMIINPCGNDKELCVFEANITTSKGVFTGHGDATPKNVGKMIIPHLIRMAETRAIARALRFALNLDTIAEELGEDQFEKSKTIKSKFSLAEEIFSACKTLNDFRIEHNKALSYYKMGEDGIDPEYLKIYDKHEARLVEGK